MLVLLPPSEAKHRPRRGRPATTADASFPELAPARRRVLEALARVSDRPDATELLGVAAGRAPEVAANTRYATAPGVTVRDLYTGVLYAALDLPGLEPAARRRAASRLLVLSAAHGVLRPGDRVAPYRLAMGVDLPGVGPLAGFWRPLLAAVLDPLAAGRLVVDCRSSDYAAAWRPGAAAASRTVAVAVVRDAAGRRSAVSHRAKHTRGLLTRHLLDRGGRDPRTPAALAAAAAEAFRVELDEPPRAGRPWTLTVVEP